SVVLELPAISRLTRKAGVFLRGEGVEEGAIHRVEMTLDELLTNAATHGRGGGLKAEVRLGGFNERCDVEGLDAAEPFDPGAAADVDVAAPAEARGIGGLGLHLVIKLSHDLQYSRHKGRNRTRCWISRESADGAGT